MAMTAHDVRHLTTCCACGALADSRDLIEDAHMFWHGRCYRERFGVDALLRLPSAQTDKLTLGDIGGDTMRALLGQRTA